MAQKLQSKIKNNELTFMFYDHKLKKILDLYFCINCGIYIDFIFDEVRYYRKASDAYINRNVIVKSCSSERMRQLLE